MDIGDWVRITGGVFAGKRGVIQGINFFTQEFYVVIAGEAFEPAVEVAWSDTKPGR